MYHIAIVDDDPSICNQARKVVENLSLTMNLSTSVETFCDAKSFLACMVSTPFALVLLDIRMNDMDGLECARQLRLTDPNTIIIFITSMVQYAVQGYKVDALDYIVKPFTDRQLEESLMRAFKRLHRTMPQTVTVRTSGGMSTIRISSIRYVEARNHSTLIHTASSQNHCPMTLRSLETMLAPYGFFRCHAAFLVNLDMVDQVTSSDAVVFGENIPVSKHRRKEFLQALTDWWSLRL